MYVYMQCQVIAARFRMGWPGAGTPSLLCSALTIAHIHVVKGLLLQRRLVSLVGRQAPVAWKRGETERGEGGETFFFLLQASSRDFCHEISLLPGRGERGPGRVFLA